MNDEDRRAITACVADGVTRALVRLKLVEEFPHPITGSPIQGKHIGKFIAPACEPLELDEPVVKRVARKARKR
jgi:hypothetical protein